MWFNVKADGDNHISANHTGTFTSSLNHMGAQVQEPHQYQLHTLPHFRPEDESLQGS